MSDLWIGILVLAVIGILYPCAIYPLLLVIGARVAGRKQVVHHQDGIEGFTVIIPAHNEERVIVRKLSNTLAATAASGLPAQIIVAAEGLHGRDVCNRS